MKRAAYSLALLAILLPMAAEAKPKVGRREPGMRWVSDLDAAIQEAKDRNIPLFVALHKDH
ncbi:MAG: hypothetical protein ACYTDY_10285 [Planctomycetota bacterium]|jgi:hypothetical protein